MIGFTLWDGLRHTRLPAPTNSPRRASRRLPVARHSAPRRYAWAMIGAYCDFNNKSWIWLFSAGAGLYFSAICS
jgi:hypothetical protein